MSKKLLIVGGVAGGATAAARARRLDETAEIVLFERGEYISFANCGLPYYIGKVIKERETLLVTTAEAFKARYNIDIRLFSEVIEIDRAEKHVTIKDTKTGDIHIEKYDKIILSPGAEPLRPPLDGIDLENIYSLRSIPDSDLIKAQVEDKKPGSAVIVGGGFIGLEMAENLAHRGIKVTIIEMLDQVMAPIDYEMASIVHAHLKEKGVTLILGDGVKSFSKSGNGIKVTTGKGAEAECEMVILSIGVRSESIIAKQAGLVIGKRGGIIVDSGMRTSDPDIFAVGDAVETRDFVLGYPAMTALAGPANKEARIAADNAMGRNVVFKGTLGSSVAKVFDLTVASTGSNEKTLKQNNIPYIVSYTHSGSHASYYPDPEMMSIKLVFSPGSGRILGAQIVGGKGVDKRIDVIATAIRGGMTVYDLEELELAYAPPFSSAKDPINIAGFVAANILKGDLETINWDELNDISSDEILIDLRDKEEIEESGTIEGSLLIPLDELRGRLNELDKSKSYIPYCAIGLRGYLGYRILIQNGFRAKNLSGGYKTWKPATN
ncbi:MAG: FAD-dependent oxidoreductase [Desulfobacteraceae bacterium]|jgi:NADPH-dependent 2,4-dienoyl-CoA reductase/sulfur reductase-like enzyme/rhodanese-related sulfurtransferase